MSFFVVARTSDGDLHLVSPTTFPTRQAAMSALSEATREPDFAHWDAELLVVDLDSAVPVLLVRPTVAEAIEDPQVVEEAVEDDQSAAEIVIDDGTAEEIVVTELGTLEESKVFDAYTIEDVAIGDAIAEEILAELDAETEGPVEFGREESLDTEQAETQVEPAEVEAEVEPETETSGTPTVSALLAESAIVDSILDSGGPREVLAVDEVFGDLVVGEPESSESAEPVSIDERLGLETPVEESPPSAWAPDEMNPAVNAVETVEAVEPFESVAEGVVAETPVEQLEGGVVIAWPWDTKPADTAAPAVDALIADIELVPPAVEPLEDPGLEDSGLESLLVEPSTLESETLAEPHSVEGSETGAKEPEAVSSAIDEPRVVDEVVDAESDSEAESDILADEDSGVVGTVVGSEVVELGETPPEQAEIADVVEDIEVTELSAVEEQPVPSSRDEIADFIFELENVTDIPEAVAEEQGVADTESPSCGECVYDETCPNRDQRSPGECGSFQWKIA